MPWGQAWYISHEVELRGEVGFPCVYPDRDYCRVTASCSYRARNLRACQMIGQHESYNNEHWYCT